MFDTEYQRLVETAKERAFLRFQEHVHLALQDAGMNIVKEMQKARSDQERDVLTGARAFVQQECDVFQSRMDNLFRRYLDRAIQTMYVDLRDDVRQLSSDELSLIGDEVINHQIEIGRLAQRMREANEVSIARLNVIIGMLHGRREAKERENPFRPYLLARTLYEAVRGIPISAPKARILFDHLADAMIQHLPEYYSAIRDVFENSGINGKFTIQTDKDPFHIPYSDLSQIPVSASPSQPGTQASSDLTGLIDIPALLGEGGEKTDTAQELIRIKEVMLRVPHNTAMRKSTRAHSLVAQLAQLQKKIVSDEGEGGKTSRDDEQLFELRDSLDLSRASAMERLTVEVIGILFSLIHKNKQISADLRCRIVRLQVPILKAAILAPEVLHDDDHPVNQLFNRISSLAVEIDPQSERGGKLAAEIDRIVELILENFEDDLSIFATALDELGQCLADVSSQVKLGIQALEAAEKISILLVSMTATLNDLLLPLNLDKCIFDFIIAVWPRVLVRAAWSDAENSALQGHETNEFLAYRNILPDLLWSIQDKPILKDRALLVRMLPDLVKGIKQALETIALPEDESKEIMNQIVTMHTQILRGAKTERAASLMNLDMDELRQIFSRLVMYWQHVLWDADEPPQIREEAVEEVLAHYRITPIVHFTQAAVVASADDHDLLERTCLLGGKVTMRTTDDSNRQAQLMWISKYRSLYLFKRDGDDVLVIYTYASLLEALRQGTITSADCASLFEHAIDSLLHNAEKSRIDPAA